MPIPDNPLGTTLVYALECERGLVLVDAGWEHEDSWTSLRDGLGSLGLDIHDVYGVVVTHYHPDHSGLAGRVRETSGAWIAMHHADNAMVRRFTSMVEQDTDRNWEGATLRLGGAPESDIAALTGRNGAGAVDPPAVADRELDDTQLVDVPGRRLRVIWTPGHSPGHMCLHLEDDDRIFTGDHVLPRITPHIGLYPYDIPDVDPLGDFLESLTKVAKVNAAHVLPAHQYPFDGLAERAAEISAHHEERLDELTALLSGRAATLWELSAQMAWRYPWDEMTPLARRMAAGEAAAHLRTLEKRGIAQRVGTAEPLLFVLR